MPISFQLGYIYSDRVEALLIHARTDKLHNLIRIYYIFSLFTSSSVQILNIVRREYPQA